MALGSITLRLYIYSGTEGSYSDADLKYTLSKNIINGQNNIVLEIAELVRDYLDISFDGTYTSHTKWVSAVVNYRDTEGREYTYSNPETFNYIAFDGYGYKVIANKKRIKINEYYHVNCKKNCYVISKWI